MPAFVLCLFVTSRTVQEINFVSTIPLGRGAFGVVYVTRVWVGGRVNALYRFAAEWRGARVAVKKLLSFIDPTLVSTCARVVCLCDDVVL
jgi:hypothetical protein